MTMFHKQVLTVMLFAVWIFLVDSADFLLWQMYYFYASLNIALDHYEGSGWPMPLSCAQALEE